MTPVLNAMIAIGLTTFLTGACASSNDLNTLAPDPFDICVQRIQELRSILPANDQQRVLIEIDRCLARVDGLEDKTRLNLAKGILALEVGRPEKVEEAALALEKMGTALILQKDGSPHDAVSSFTGITALNPTQTAVTKIRPIITAARNIN